MLSHNKTIFSLFFIRKKIILLLLFASFFGFEFYVFIVHHFEGKRDLNHLSGNFPQNREKLCQEKQKDEFSFAIVGDTKGTGTFEKIAKELRSEPLSFIVFLGDFVHKGTEGEHNYFKAEYISEFSFPFPSFFVVGNHDVDSRNFPISRFEEVYGPSIFSFEYQDCLFVVLRILNAPYSNKESLRFLEKLISEKTSSRYRKIFVFMHIPPPISSDFDARPFEGSDEIVSLIEKLNADYVIAGDYHGYARITRKDTVYLVTGGGGAHLEEKKFGSFHHALVLEVTKDCVSEKILVVNRDEKLQDRIERFALASMYPWLTNNLFAASLLNIILLTISITLCKHIYQSFKVLRINFDPGKKDCFYDKHTMHSVDKIEETKTFS
ncbi:MAG: metallophosphoesterase [Candidatus Brocadia sp.]